MLRRIKEFTGKLLLGRSRGVALIEVTIAVVVLGLITASVPPIFVLIAKADFRQNEQRVSEYLVRNQMEYVKSADYIAGNVTNPEPDYGTVPVPNESYLINVEARPVIIYQDEEEPEKKEHAYLDPGLDEGIQEITVEIYHVNLNVGVDRPVLTARNYKVLR